MATGKEQRSWQLRKYVIRAALSLLMALERRERRPPATSERSTNGLDILLTGTFYSQNWINSQLKPLTLADSIAKVTFVSTTPVSEVAGLNVIYPPKFLRTLIGAVPARLLTFVWQGIRKKPDVVGGYHLLVNGLVALATSKITRAKSLYICVGGPTEVAGGGYATENRIFGRLKRPDPEIEKQLLAAVNAFDCVIVRGNSAKTYFEEKGIQAPIRIITAAVDASVFSPNDKCPEYDLVFLARLSPVKRVELFLKIVECLKNGDEPGIKALIIGDGPSRQCAEQIISETGLHDHVHMVGHQDDIPPLLNLARVFVLTSKSEGLSQAMVQAMLCGLPAVVANVGALADLVRNDQSGYLIDNHGEASDYARPICTLLDNANRLQKMGVLARQSALNCSTASVTRKWNDVVAESF